MDCKAKTERILQLQEKNMQAVVQTPGWLICFIWRCSYGIIHLCLFMLLLEHFMVNDYI